MQCASTLFYFLRNVINLLYFKNYYSLKNNNASRLFEQGKNNIYIHNICIKPIKYSAYCIKACSQTARALLPMLLYHNIQAESALSLLSLNSKTKKAPHDTTLRTTNIVEIMTF